MHPYRALALQFWVAQSIFFAKIRWWDDVVDDVAMCFVCLCVCVFFFGFPERHEGYLYVNLK